MNNNEVALRIKDHEVDTSSSREGDELLDPQIQ